MLLAFAIGRIAVLDRDRGLQPRLEVKDAVVHLGRIPTSQPIGCRFTLANAGGARLLITETKAYWQQVVGDIQ